MESDMSADLPGDDIGNLLRMGCAGGSRERPAGGGGSLMSRIGPVPRPGRITKRSRGHSNGCAGSRSLGRGRLPIMSGMPLSDRRFDTEVHGMRAVNDFRSGLRRLESDPASMVIAVHGTCRSSSGRAGRAGARAGFGVFVSRFAEDLNRNGLVPYLSPQTNQYAELFAAMRAVDVVHDLIMAGEDLTHVIIKSTLEYLVEGMSVWIWKWVGNGFMNCQGLPMVNGRAFKYLHEKIVLLERDYGTRVSFCRVSKEFNEPATALALEAVR